MKYVIYHFTHENILTRQIPVSFISRKKYVKYWSIRILLGSHTHVSLHKKNEEILNGKLHFLFSVYKLNNDYLSEFIWFVFSRTWTEYGERLCISPHSIRMRENAEQKKPRIRTFFTQYPFLYMIR